jgi:biopolymer transport protein ExbD
MRLPLVALIDVVLFLLLYFVVSYSVSGEERELGVALATIGTGMQAGAAGSEPRPQMVLVRWAGEGPEFRVGSDVVAGGRALVALLEGLPKEPGMVVAAAADAPVEATAAAIQAGRDAGFEKISYAIVGP